MGAEALKVEVGSYGEGFKRNDRQVLPLRGRIWIPAFAGMNGFFTGCRIANRAIRHHKACPCALRSPNLM